jgi:hypothetical protein
VTGWTAKRIRTAAHEWVWVPEQAEEVRTADYHLVAYPPAFMVPTHVAWCRSDRPAGELVDEVVDHVREWRRADVSFWVGESTRPADLVEHLRERGARHIETVEILALELELLDELVVVDPAPGVTLRVVDDAESARDAALVATEVWGQSETTAAVPGADPTDFRVVAYVDGEPACAGGCTVVGEVARLWGAATRPHVRGRGAYRALLAERLRLAVAAGATLGLAKGVVETSAPILRRLGFSGYGLERRYQLEL